MLMVDKQNGTPKASAARATKDLAVSTLHAAESRGSKSDRHGHVLADHRGPNRPILYVHGHTLPKANRRKIPFVGRYVLSVQEPEST
jgi:hypothetical protein